MEEPKALSKLFLDDIVDVSDECVIVITKPAGVHGWRGHVHVEKGADNIHRRLAFDGIDTLLWHLGEGFLRKKPEPMEDKRAD